MGEKWVHRQVSPDTVVSTKVDGSEGPGLGCWGYLLLLAAPTAGAIAAYNGLCFGPFETTCGEGSAIAIRLFAGVFQGLFGAVALIAVWVVFLVLRTIAGRLRGE